MKKHIVNITALASLFLTATVVQAAPPSAELKVKGKIGVPSCSVVAPDNGVYNLGQISATQVKPGITVNLLPVVTKTWTVTCDAQTYLNMVPTDNRRATISDTSSALNFGLGNVNNTGKIGFYTVEMKNAKVDGITSLVFYKNGPTGAFTTVASAKFQQGYNFGWAETTTTQKFGKVFTTELAVAPVLAGTSTMNGPITEDTNIDGSLTMNFAFGI